jgi:hypothetical protein
MNKFFENNLPLALKQLQSTQFKVWVCLASKSTDRGVKATKVRASLGQITKATGVSLSAVQAAVRQLKASGVVELLQVGTVKRNPSVWKLWNF